MISNDLLERVIKFCKIGVPTDDNSKKLFEKLIEDATGIDKDAQFAAIGNLLMMIKLLLEKMVSDSYFTKKITINMKDLLDEINIALENDYKDNKFSIKSVDVKEQNEHDYQIHLSNMGDCINLKEQNEHSYQMHLSNMGDCIKGNEYSLEAIKKVDRYIFDHDLNKDDIINLINILDYKSDIDIENTEKIDTDSHVKGILKALYLAYEGLLKK